MIWVVVVPHMHFDAFPDGILYFFGIHVCRDSFPSELSLSNFVSKLKKERIKGKVVKLEENKLVSECKVQLYILGHRKFGFHEN